MQTVATTQTVNAVGQITLSQHFAGKQVVVQPVADGIHIHAKHSPPDEQRSRKRLAFLESEQAVVRTERGQNADLYIREMRENDRQ